MPNTALSINGHYTNHSLSLPVTRLYFTASVSRDFSFPDYAGSLLRGAFGHALLSLALLPHTDNRPCALKDSCPYCQLFAALPIQSNGLKGIRNRPAPYVIEPPIIKHPLTKGESFRFGLVLIGQAHDYLEVIVLAFARALARGLGAGRTPCALTSVTQEDGATIWQAGRRAMAELTPMTLAQVPGTTRAQLIFTSPLRLQSQGSPIKRHELDARRLLITLARRCQLLADIHQNGQATQLNFDELVSTAASIRLSSELLQWFDWERYSSRQRRSMKLGGLIGTLTLEGDLSPFTDILHLGQWLHVGKETTFGLGQYTLNWQ